MVKIVKKYSIIQTANRQTGFSLIELLIAMTITLIIVSLAFTLLAHSLNRKTNDEAQVSALSDANQALSRMSLEIVNSGFGLRTNGLVPADCTEDKIHVRANLNALERETTSGTVTDQYEDLIFQLVPNPEGGSALVRSDVNIRESSILATRIDGLTFLYLDANGSEVTPQNAVRVEIVIRIIIPQSGRPGTSGFQPEMTKQLTSSVVLRNSCLLAY